MSNFRDEWIKVRLSSRSSICRFVVKFGLVLLEIYNLKFKVHYQDILFHFYY